MLCNFEKFKLLLCFEKQLQDEDGDQLYRFALLLFS